MTEETIEVTQADIDAAANAYSFLTQAGDNVDDFEFAIRCRKADDHAFVQTIARHRAIAERAVAVDREGMAQIIARAYGGSLYPGLGTPGDFPVSEIDYRAADALLASGSGAGDPDLGKIGPGHVCKHHVRWPHPCGECDRAAIAAMPSPPTTPASDDRPAASEVESYAAFQQRRGRLPDLIEGAISIYDDFMADDNFDQQGTLDKIAAKLKSARDWYPDAALSGSSK